jgi:AcrR family transcriptional regulator
MSEETEETAESQVLSAAETLFYAKGVRAVGMDQVRSASGFSLNRLYHLFPSKDDLVEAYLRRRDARWRRRLADYVEARPSPEDRILAVFDWLYDWFGEPGFHGCAFINAFGELGGTSSAVAGVVRFHKDQFRQYLAGLVAAADRPAPLADRLTLLAEGAMTAAAIFGSAEAARTAREAAQILLRASRPSAAGDNAIRGTSFHTAPALDSGALHDDRDGAVDDRSRGGCERRGS